MKVATKEWGVAEKNSRLSWESKPFRPDKNLILKPLSQRVDSLTQRLNIYMYLQAMRNLPMQITEGTIAMP